MGIQHKAGGGLANVIYSLRAAKKKARAKLRALCCCSTQYVVLKRMSVCVHNGKRIHAALTSCSLAVSLSRCLGLIVFSGPPTDRDAEIEDERIATLGLPC